MRQVWVQLEKLGLRTYDTYASILIPQFLSRCGCCLCMLQVEAVCMLEANPGQQGTHPALASSRFKYSVMSGLHGMTDGVVSGLKRYAVVAVLHVTRLCRSDVEVLRPGPIITLARAITPDMLQVGRGTSTTSRGGAPKKVPDTITTKSNG